MARFGSWGYGGFAPYVPVAERKRLAAREVAALAKNGKKIQPVAIAGRAIATTFWGKAWCDNLESYSDVENRLPRGRTYVRNGSVVHLGIAEGEVDALVYGSEMYTVRIGIAKVEPVRWTAIRGACAGRIGSLVELLRGRFAGDVMAVIAKPRTGLFPDPKHIEMRCSCPDVATMCKHVAAVLYGVGARLDTEPELLFRLRRADATELVAEATRAGALRASTKAKNALVGDLSAVFGIELDAPAKVPRTRASARVAPAPAPAPVSEEPRPAKKPRAARPKVPAVRTVRRAYLVALGVPQATIQYWVTTGVLERTAERGVFVETERARERLARFRR